MANEWTTTPPTEWGWYWTISNTTDNPMTRVKTIVLVRLTKTGRVKIEEPEYVDLKEITHWLGPIPDPGFPPV